MSQCKQSSLLYVSVAEFCSFYSSFSQFFSATQRVSSPSCPAASVSAYLPDFILVDIFNIRSFFPLIKDFHNSHDG